MITHTASRDRHSLRSLAPEALFFAATTSLAVGYWLVTFIG
jgi:hypothetical protein